MFNLSLKDDWINNKKFCHRLSEDEEDNDGETTKEATDRLALTKSRQSSPNSSLTTSGAASLEALEEIGAAN